MVIRLRVSGVRRETVGDDLFGALVRVFPEGRYGPGGNSFKLMLDAGDGRAQRVLDLLRANGLASGKTVAGAVVELDREYGAEDWKECQWLEVRPPPEAHSHGATERTGADESGLLLLREQMLPTFDAPVSFGFSTWFFVRERVKAILESGGLNGPTFRPTFLAATDGDPEDTAEMSVARYGRPYWELDSVHTMPRLSPRMPLSDQNGDAVEWGQDDYPNGFLRHEELYAHPQLRYRAADLAGLGGIDLARTYEAFGLQSVRHGRSQLHQPFDQPLIASRRFYRFCVDRGLDVGWVPVLIDRQ